MSLIDLASLVLAPTATKEGKVYSAIPDTGDGDMTFTRGSAATRVNSEGLIEKERANFLTYSNDFSNWSQTRNTVTSNTTTAPDGTTTADKIAANSTFVSNTSRVYQTTTVSGVNTISVYAKPNEITEMFLYGLGANNGIYFDLDNGSFLSYGSGTTNIVDYNINNEGNGWYRYSITFSVTNTRYEIYLSKNENYVNNFTEGEGFFLWNAQAENGLVAQSYIPTTTTAVYEGITDDVPRVNYSGGGCPALKLEPQRSNLVTQSEYFGAYSNFGSVDTANQETSPEGVVNATLIEGDGSYTQIYTATPNITVSSAGDYTLSIFAKKGTEDYLRLFLDGFVGSSNNSAYFDLENGTTPTSGASIENYGNGWYRCYITATIDAGDLTGKLAFNVTPSTSTVFYGSAAAADGKNIYVYGAMLEAGSYSTSYLPTYGTSTTRVQDSCSKTGISELIGQTEGTLFLNLLAIESEGSEFYQASFSDGSNNETAIFGFTNTSGQLRFRLENGGVAQCQIYANSIDTSTYVKAAIAYKENDFAFYVNGVQAGTDTSGSVPSSLTQFQFANGANTSTEMYGNIKEVVFFPTRLTNDQLQELTK